MLRMMSVAMFVLLSLSGCSTYLPDYHYLPQPALVVIPQGFPPAATQPVQTSTTLPTVAVEPPAMNVLGTVLGVRRGDEWHNIPEAVEIRLRLENGPTPAMFDPSQIQLMTATLVPLGSGQATPKQPVELSPGQDYGVTVIFPLPAGASEDTLDLRGLRLSVPLTIDGHPVQAAMNFQRILTYTIYTPMYERPYYEPYYHRYPTYYGRPLNRFR